MWTKSLSMIAASALLLTLSACSSNPPISALKVPEIKPAPIDPYWLEACQPMEVVPDYGLTEESSQEQIQAAWREAMKVIARNMRGYALCIGRHDGLAGEVIAREAQ